MSKPTLPKLIGKTNMAKKEISAEDLKTLCDFDESTNTYVSKKGQEYSDALKALLHPNSEGNKNDRPFLYQEIIKQPTFQKFGHRFKELSQFVFNCYLKANPMTLDANGELIDLGNNKKSKEEIVAFNFANKAAEKVFNSSIGVVYIITCPISNNEHIIKIGQTGGTFKKRLGSYNCGYVANRLKGTASTTNFKIVQSFVATRLEFKLYIKDCNSLAKKYRWARMETSFIASPLVEAIENICLSKFKSKFPKLKKPLANIQTKKQTED